MGQGIETAVVEPPGLKRPLLSILVEGRKINLKRPLLEEGLPLEGVALEQPNRKLQTQIEEFQDLHKVRKTETQHPK